MYIYNLHIFTHNHENDNDDNLFICIQILYVYTLHCVYIYTYTHMVLIIILCIYIYIMHIVYCSILLIVKLYRAMRSNLVAHLDAAYARILYYTQKDLHYLSIYLLRMHTCFILRCKTCTMCCTCTRSSFYALRSLPSPSLMHS